MADSASDTTQSSSTGADAIQPYVDNAKETIKPILEEPEMDDFLRAHIQKIPEWNEWSEAARQAYAHMMTSQMLQRKAAATQISIGHAFRLPDYSAIKNLGLLLQRKPLPPPPKKKRKRPVAVETEVASTTEVTEPTVKGVATASEELATPETKVTDAGTTEATKAENPDTAEASDAPHTETTGNEEKTET